MFDVDQFIADCRAAGDEGEPLLAVKDLLKRVMARPAEVADVFPPRRAEIVPLYLATDLSVFRIVWAPHMRLRAHNHLMWGAIGIFGGGEDNTFYRRTEHAITMAGGRALRTGDVAVFGADVIHAVVNPDARFTGAIHVYGGDLTTQAGRSQWDDDTLEERPFDFAGTEQQFEAANLALRAAQPEM
jgi:predicted metal-dependent enzyme (double-stranded beta helix superfamily)